MAQLKAMANIFGTIRVTIKEILSKGIGMDMVFGNQPIKNNNIRGIICSIENMVMEFTIGEMVLSIKASTQKMLGLDKANYMKMDS